MDEPVRRTLVAVGLLLVAAVPTTAAPAPADVSLDMDQSTVEVSPELPAQVWLTVTARIRCAYDAPPPPELELYLGPSSDSGAHAWQLAPDRFTIPWRSAGAQLTQPPLMPPNGFHDWEVVQAVNATATAGPEAPDVVVDNRWILPTFSSDGPECTPDGMYYDAQWVDFQVVVHSAGDAGPLATAQEYAMLPASAGASIVGGGLLAGLAALVVFVLLHARRRVG